MGVDNPRPTHRSTPGVPFETFIISSSEDLECWRMNVPNARGTMIMFHGYAGEKSSLLARAEKLREMKFNTILVDFAGSGGSDGNHTTIGFDEAEQVKNCYDFISKSDARVHLFGTSMGAAAILKAIKDYELKPQSIVLECPFGSLSETVEARFKMMGVPTFPMATLLTFWGGVQNGYWAFSHNPSEYAKFVSVPALILYGEQDQRVTLSESKEIFKNLQGRKGLVTYPNAGHNVFATENQQKWAKDVREFLSR